MSRTLALVAIALAPVPAFAAGMLAVRGAALPPSMRALQLGALASALLAYGAIVRVGRDRLLEHAASASALALVALAATRVMPGVVGVHRWVPLGPLRLHPSAALAGFLLLGVASLLRRDRERAAMGLAFGTELVHLLQPDAAQASAFGAGAIVLFAALAPRSRTRWLAAAFVTASIALAWRRPDPLAPVPHVEGIVGLSSAHGPALLGFAVASLALLPLSGLMLAWRLRGDRFSLAFCLSLTAYFAFELVASAAGAFPVPVMGMGASPILGTYVGFAIVAALGWGNACGSPEGSAGA